MNMPHGLRGYTTGKICTRQTWFQFYWVFFSDSAVEEEPPPVKQKCFSAQKVSLANSTPVLVHVASRAERSKEGGSEGWRAYFYFGACPMYSCLDIDHSIPFEAERRCYVLLF